jgi:DNA-binding transcriptional regulator YiaG
LAGIYLHNGYEAVEHDGEKYVSIKDTLGLNRCIGEHIVYTRKELTAEEIKFLRKTMDMTQSELGQWMGYSSQQVARWEKAQAAIPDPAGRLFRALFLDKMRRPDECWSFMELLTSIEEIDDTPPRELSFCFDGDSWQQDRRVPEPEYA